MLSEQENDQLVEWARCSKPAQALALRSRIVLASGQGPPKREVARRLSITVCADGGAAVSSNAGWMVCLMNRGPEAPHKIGDAKVEAVIAKTLH